MEMLETWLIETVKNNVADRDFNEGSIHAAPETEGSEGSVGSGRILLHAESTTRCQT